MRHIKWRLVVGVTGFALLTALTTSGCPAPHDVRIDLSRAGVDKLIASCNATECGSLCCGVEELSFPTSGDANFFSLQLLVVSTDGSPKNTTDVELRAVSDCVGYAHTCESLDATGCIRSSLNEALEGSIAGGLGEFDDPSDVVVAMALFNTPGESVVSCQPSEMFACAGLSPAFPGSDAYDITCASCNGRLKNADVPPCFSNCFVNVCYQILEELG